MAALTKDELDRFVPHRCYWGFCHNPPAFSIFDKDRMKPEESYCTEHIGEVAAQPYMKPMYLKAPRWMVVPIREENDGISK